MRCFAAMLIFLMAASSASAQIIYQPVRYEYGSQTRYYYGGNDPRLLQFADNSAAAARLRDGSLSIERERVYSDAIPFQNARIHGVTAADARNDAYANSPNYFRKSDLLNSAIRAADGSIIVPNQISASPRLFNSPPTTAPSAAAAPNVPQPMLIIPKRKLDSSSPPRVASRE